MTGSDPDDDALTGEAELPFEKSDTGPPPRSVPRFTSSMELEQLGVSGEDQHRIAELYVRLDRIDHYALLGVAATDDAKTIKRAYFALAREYHPDRWFRKDIGALKPKIDAIFAALTKALDTLADAKRRVEYDTYLREHLKTRFERRQALALEGAGSWQAAADTWARVLEKLPNDAYVNHRYAHALLRARSGYATATAAATRATELEPMRAEYRITAASLHIAEERDRMALAQLAIAVQIEPTRDDLAALHAALAERVDRGR